VLANGTSSFEQTPLQPVARSASNIDAVSPEAIKGEEVTCNDEVDNDKDGETDKDDDDCEEDCDDDVDNDDDGKTDKDDDDCEDDNNEEVDNNEEDDNEDDDSDDELSYDYPDYGGGYTEDEGDDVEMAQ
jgi:ribonuclease E